MNPCRLNELTALVLKHQYQFGFNCHLSILLNRLFAFHLSKFYCFRAVLVVHCLFGGALVLHKVSSQVHFFASVLNWKKNDDEQRRV